MSEPDETAPIHRVSPSGRVPQWVLDEAAGREPVGVTGRDWFVEEPPPPPRKRRRGRVVLGLVTLAAVVAGVVYLPELADRSPEIPQAAAEVPAAVAAPSGFPTPGVGASDSRARASVTMASAPSGAPSRLRTTSTGRHGS